MGGARAWIWVVCGLCAVGCRQAEATGPVLPAPAPSAQVLDQAPDDAAPRAPIVPVEVTPTDAAAALPVEPWPMEPLASWDPGFPFLAGEARGVSRSVGDVQEGWLVDGVAISAPRANLTILPVQAARGLNYTTQGMAALLDGAAAHVAARHPGTITALGNLSAPGGGDIPYSVSHNSGRDADVAFFVTDEAGRPATLPDLLPLDRKGRYEGEHGVFLFDVARSWTLVEGFIRHGGGQLQVIFVSTSLKRMLLEHARATGADAALVERADKLLVQPKGALPHDDHFHLRIFCSVDDKRSGCVDGAKGGPGHEGARAEAVRDAVAALKAAEASERVAGARRLALVGGKGEVKALSALLSDGSPQVRAAASRALSELGAGAGPIAAALREEQSPEVVAEHIGALGRVGGRGAVSALIRVVDRKKPQPLALSALEAPTDARALAADALASLAAEQAVEALMRRLDDGDAEVRQRASRALALITNHEFLDDWRASSGRSRKAAREAWAAWWKEHGKAGRARWLAMGFVAAGYTVEALDRLHVWELCKAITGPYHISQNAQRALMALLDHDVPSVQWSVEDASFYWRRWLERKRKLFKLPARPKGWASEL